MDTLLTPLLYISLHLNLILNSGLLNLQNQSNSLNLWIQDMEQFLTAEAPAFGDHDTLKAQITESNVGVVLLCVLSICETL